MTPDPHIGSFRLIELLGEGGMGRVYRAEHERTGMDVALKLLAGESDSTSADRFDREVRSHARIVHPGIAYLFDYGAVDGDSVTQLHGEYSGQLPYVAMELAEGGTLRDLMPLNDWEQVQTVMRQVFDALAFAHAREVVHRDLKPENLLVFYGEDGGLRIKISDFGLAYVFEQLAEPEEYDLRRAGELIELLHVAVAAGEGEPEKLDRLLADEIRRWCDECSVSRDHVWIVELEAELAEEVGGSRCRRELLELADEWSDRLADAGTGIR